jgi:uncharacterized protein
LIDLLVLQSTPFCNINCDYCYLPDRSSIRKLSIDTLDVTFRRLLSSGLLGPRLSIVWHAGEPLVTPVSFYATAFARIREISGADLMISHAFQTNGTLITQEWCDLISAHQVNVGVSLDGPAFIHDAHRKTRAGNGTHQRVMQGISLLQRNGIDFHVIAVVTGGSLDFPDEIFQFFLDSGIKRVGFNVEEVEGVHLSSSLRTTSPPVHDRYVRFMSRLYQRAKATKGALSIREFDQAFHSICDGEPTPGRGFLTANHQTTPFRIVSVDCDGRVSTFSPELLGQRSAQYGDFIFGNVQADGFDAIASNDRFLAVQQDIAAGVELCRRTCQYFELCGGGAPANKYFEHGTFCSTATMYCRYSIQVPLDIVLTDLEASLLGRK